MSQLRQALCCVQARSTGFVNQVLSVAPATSEAAIVHLASNPADLTASRRSVVVVRALRERFEACARSVEYTSSASARMYATKRRITAEKLCGSCDPRVLHISSPNVGRLLYFIE
jgi:hypothetical protein